MALGKRRAKKKANRPKRNGLNHSAYCMMIRSLYDLYPKKKRY